MENYLFFLTGLSQVNHTNHTYANFTVPNITDAYSCYPETHYGFVYVRWIKTVFGTCVYTPTDMAGFVIGLLCTFCWICYMMPQITKTCCTCNVEGISFGFYLFWFFGDSLNFFGALLSNQEMTQMITGGYYIIMDVITISQFLVCKIQYRVRRMTRKKKLEESEMNSQPPDNLTSEEKDISEDGEKRRNININNPVDYDDEEERQSLLFQSTTTTTTREYDDDIIDHNNNNNNNQILYGVMLTFVTIFFLILFTSSSSSSSSSNYNYNSQFPPGRTLLIEGNKDPNHKSSTKLWVVIIGYIMGCVYAFLTVTARWWQIFKNYKNKGTTGLSIFLFFFTLAGNSTYAISLLLYSIQSFDGFWLFMLKKLPWMTGVCGGFCMDLIILFQFCRYGDWKWKKLVIEPQNKWCFDRIFGRVENDGKNKKKEGLLLIKGKDEKKRESDDVKEINNDNGFDDDDHIKL